MMDGRRPCQTSTLPLQTTNCAESEPHSYFRILLQLKNREGLGTTSALTDECVGAKCHICLSRFWSPGDGVKFTPVEVAAKHAHFSYPHAESAAA